METQLVPSPLALHPRCRMLGQFGTPRMPYPVVPTAQTPGACRGHFEGALLSTKAQQIDRAVTLLPRVDLL